MGATGYFSSFLSTLENQADVALVLFLSGMGGKAEFAERYTHCCYFVSQRSYPINEF